MKFGRVQLSDAVGALLAHSLKVTHQNHQRKLPKGHQLSKDDIALLAAEGFDSVIAARLSDEDVHENIAAERLAAAAAGKQVYLAEPFTGRVNLFAQTSGLLRVNRAAVDATNRIDPAITFATLDDHASVQKGQMVATAKIIPFAANKSSLRLARRQIESAVNVAPFKSMRVGLIATTLPHLTEKTLDKSRRVTEGRLAVSGSSVFREDRVSHDQDILASALKTQIESGVDLILIFGASAVVDEADVIPAAVKQAGGEIHHLGMPVDPGNLLVLGSLAGKPVVGAPGCARSPKENGFDWVLTRLLAEQTITPKDITGMGVGGLLTEIGARPHPRKTPPRPLKKPAKVAGVLLGAGSSTRMRGPNKLLCLLDGEPLIHRAARHACDSRLTSVLLVTGHMANNVAAAVKDLDLLLVHNPDHREGIASSIRAALTALPHDVDGVMFLLGDMPSIDAPSIDALIEAMDPEDERSIIVAASEGQRANPVLFSRNYLDELRMLEGDQGAKHIVQRDADHVKMVEIGFGARLDLDTPEALAAIGGQAVDSPRNTNSN